MSMRRFAYMFLTALALLSLSESVTAQRMPERRLVRMGNRRYDKGDFERSAELYRQALSKDSTSFEAGYDLGNALFRAGRYDAAEQALRRVAADTARTDAERAEAWFNLGDVQFAQQNLQGALESFRQSLRLNPSDMEAKYNYAYVKKMLEQQEQQEQEQQNDDKDNKGDNNDKDNNKDNKDSDGGQNRNQEQDGDGDNDDGRNPQDSRGEQNSGDGSQPRQGQISPEQLEAMLEAIQAQEDKTQEKVKEKQGVIVRGSKNW